MYIKTATLLAYTHDFCSIFIVKILKMTKNEQKPMFSTFCDLNCRWLFIKSDQKDTEILCFCIFPCFCWSDRPSLTQEPDFQQLRNLHLPFISGGPSDKFHQIWQILMLTGIQISVFDRFGDFCLNQYAPAFCQQKVTTCD